jgi:hypothetical protein
MRSTQPELPSSPTQVPTRYERAVAAARAQRAVEVMAERARGDAEWADWLYAFRVAAVANDLAAMRVYYATLGFEV